MVPAHFVVSIELVGCPDPNPRYDRYFAPERANLPADLDELGHRYVSRLSEACDRWLDGIDPREPIGVLFSGGIDSGALFLILHDRLLRRGEVPTRLKAFTLRIEDAPDSRQAFDFLNRLDMSMYLEVIEASREDVDFRKAVKLIEDYKPLDVQAAAMAFALCGGIRKAYPDWKYLADGDGGDENLKDYPIEENPELTIRSVLNNSMLYHEGWGVHAIKHSLTYTGGQSRGHVRSYAPAAHFGFRAFSPYALTSVIEVSEGIPYVELTDWDHERLYALKGEIVSRGVEQLTGHEMPVFEKRRFQHGAVSADRFEDLFPADEAPYRAALADAYR
jgi:asparagine synthase (glutamine-hydrolysing)